MFMHESVYVYRFCACVGVLGSQIFVYVCDRSWSCVCMCVIAYVRVVVVDVIAYVHA